MNRAPGALLRNAGYWIAPQLLCLLLYRRSLRAWFRADDFAWLSSGLDVRTFHDLLLVLFSPAAQGTIRPWSEPVFFLAGYNLFGLNALPFHIVLFATHFVNLALVASIGTRLTGRRAAGLWAAIFWVMNGSLVEPLGWICTYNQVLCGLFLLMAFHFLLRYIETGEARYSVFQWITFLLGFGALELNLIYPVLAAGYTFLRARKYFRSTLPLGIVSAIYVALHLAAAPLPRSGTYAFHIGGSLLRTLAAYWTWSVGPTYTYTPLPLPSWALPLGITIVSVALLAFAAAQLRRHSGAALFCLLWFLVAIAPVLPFGDHMTEYYVYVPVIALCWLGGWGLAASWRAGVVPRAAAVTVAAAYALMGIPEAVAGTRWNYELTVRARSLVEGVERAHQLHPDKSILLEGVDQELFWNSVQHQPFRLVGAGQVYLAPGSQSRIGPDAAQFELNSGATIRALSRGDLVVYETRGPRLRNVTGIYAAVPRQAKTPALLDAANPLTAYLLGPEWYGIDEDHRWMPKRATLRMAGPEHPGERLYIHGGTTRELTGSGPVTVVITVNGSPLPPATIARGQEDFAWSFPLPDTLVGKPEIHVEIAASRAFRSRSDRRELALHFGTFDLR